MTSDNKDKPPQDAEPARDEEKLVTERREKLAALRTRGIAFPNDFRRNVMAGELHAEYGAKDNTQLEAQPVRVHIAGRMMTCRIMGKASFVHVQDMSGKMQLYVQRDTIGEDLYSEFKKWDVGFANPFHQFWFLVFRLP